MIRTRSPLRSAAVIVAALGLVLSIALEVVHYRAYTAPGASSFCSVGDKLDCVSVALSRYSVMLGVPVPLWGVAAFLAMLAAAYRGSRWLLPLGALATLGSTALLAVELFALHTVCLLCEGVHLASIALLVLAWRQRRTPSEAYGERDGLLAVFAPAVGLIIALLIFQPPYWAVFGWRGDLPFAQGTTAEGYPWIGAAEPTLIVHEFTDYSCPHCKVASSRMLKELAARPKQLRLVRRQYTRMSCPPGVKGACQLARIAYCAQEQGKFWQADRWLFEHATARHQVNLGEAARDIGLDEGKLRACVERSNTYDRAYADSKDATKLRLLGTPAYIVGDKKLSATEVTKLIDAL